MRHSLKLIEENVSRHVHGNHATVDGALGFISLRLVDGLQTTTPFGDPRTADRYMAKVSYLNRDVFVCDVPHRECCQCEADLLPLTIDAELLKTLEIPIVFQSLFEILKQGNKSIAYGNGSSQLRRSLAPLRIEAMHKRYESRGRHSQHAPDCLPQSQPVSPMERRHA